MPDGPSRAAPGERPPGTPRRADPGERPPGTPRRADPGERPPGTPRRAHAPDQEELLALACAVAQEAGAMLADRSGSAVVVATKSSSTDIVTEMDQASERLIARRILAERPSDSILGEEGGETRGERRGETQGETGRHGQTPVRWIVDPLDGTVNYLYGLPDWAVSVAAEVDGQIVAGAVCVPRRDALYFAQLGGGAWRATLTEPGTAPQQLHCTTDVPLTKALIATGFGYEPARRLVQGQVVAALLPRVRDIRRNGAAAVDLCSLAAGNVDGYYERGVQYWDIAAGSLIAREAGAIVAGLDGNPAGPEMTVGSGPGLFAELHDLLLSQNPERDA